MLLFRFGGDLLSHVLRRSTIGVLALNCRVREGIGCFTSTMTTKPKKKHISLSVKTEVTSVSVQSFIDYIVCSKFRSIVLLTVGIGFHQSDDPEALPF